MNMASQAVGGAGARSGEAAAQRALGKDDFLKLLVTQLRYQDPLEPVDNTGFIAQLAQFSTLEGITNMGASLDTMASGVASMNNYYATWLIGKEIRAQGNTVTLGGNGTGAVSYKLSSEASKVAITVRDESGAAVRTLEEGARPAGLNTILWDGKDASGGVLAPGRYTFTVTAASADGAAVGTDTFSTGVANGVVYENGVPYVVVNGAKVSIGSVLEVWSR